MVASSKVMTIKVCFLLIVMDVLLVFMGPYWTSRPSLTPVSRHRAARRIASEREGGGGRGRDVLPSGVCSRPGRCLICNQLWSAGQPRPLRFPVETSNHCSFGLTSQAPSSIHLSDGFKCLCVGSRLAGERRCCLR
ncbi:hypothetical protein SKAU_G00310910 [Synaphobranchus kaupii]|uniref:Uncharacterized protein n=1 Tax=Synaphobranchus kaupii TaxID=118154 RepID=A0A9Q1ERS9_SYNKA|nr:hypothetical protein SKAU_G00310910 [Synaphobranchus kaupii]